MSFPAAILIRRLYYTIRTSTVLRCGIRRRRRREALFFARRLLSGAGPLLLLLVSPIRECPTTTTQQRRRRRRRRRRQLEPLLSPPSLRGTGRSGGAEFQLLPWAEMRICQVLLKNTFPQIYIPFFFFFRQRMAILVPCYKGPLFPSLFFSRRRLLF